MAEGIDINKSLLTLRKVLEDLASRKNHVPYRASMLTKILRTPFENGYVTFLATVNASNTTETKRTLDYACITRRITFTKAQSVASKTYQNTNCICQDCLRRVFRGSFGAERYPSILFCKFCGNEIGTLSETDESFVTRENRTVPVKVHLYQMGWSLLESRALRVIPWRTYLDALAHSVILSAFQRFIT